jgi:hypothetical protein
MKQGNQFLLLLGPSLTATLFEANVNIGINFLTVRYRINENKSQFGHLS